MLYDWKKIAVVHKHVSTQKWKLITMINILAIMNRWNGINNTSGRNLCRWKSTFESSCEDKNEKRNTNGLGLCSCWYKKSLTQLQKVITCVLGFLLRSKKTPKLQNYIICSYTWLTWVTVKWKPFPASVLEQSKGTSGL